MDYFYVKEKKIDWKKNAKVRLVTKVSTTGLLVNECFIDS